MRDGYQGWTRAKEEGWDRVFGSKPLSEDTIEVLRTAGKFLAEISNRGVYGSSERVADYRTRALHANRCDPPCDTCKCPKGD